MSLQANRLLPALLGLLLAVPLATIMPAGAVIEHINEDQEDVLEAYFGLGAPHGRWQETNEWSRLYLHNPIPNEAWRETGLVGAAVQASSQNFGMDFMYPGSCENDVADILVEGLICPREDAAPDNENPTDVVIGGPQHDQLGLLRATNGQACIGDTDPIIDNPARFIATPITFTDTTIYDLAIGLRDASGQPNQAGVINVYVSHVDPANPLDINETQCITWFSTGTVTQGGFYTAGKSLGLDGYTVPAGRQLQVILTSAQGATIEIDGSGSPAYFDINADTARVNLWTEGRFDEVMTSFPLGAGTSTTDRRIEFNAVVSDPFGVEPCAFQASPNDPANWCPEDNFDQNEVRFRVRDLTPSHRTSVDPSWSQPWSYNQYLPMDQTLGLKGDPDRDDRLVRCCDLIIDPIEYNPEDIPSDSGVTHLRYTFVYGADFPPGTYQIEFHHGGKGWKFYHDIEIGRTGFSFEFAPGEAVVSQDGTTARHTVRVGETTEYVVRVHNTGGASETFGISIPTPQTASLQVSVQPNTQTVPPGDHADFTVTITPPAQGVVAGDKKVVFVRAVGLTDNTVKELATETTYVGYNSFIKAQLPKGIEQPYGIDLTTTRSFIETRPGHLESFPIVMRNLGTVGEDFVLTAEGVPDGWTVDLIPAFDHVYAASREDVIVQIYVPEEAVPPLDPATQCVNDATADPPRTAEPGCSWTLFLRARKAFDSAIQDVLEIPVTIFLVDDFDTSFLAPTIHMRDVARSQFLCESDAATGTLSPVGFFCTETHADVQFDQSALFRLKVENAGDRVDTIKMTASWNPNVGVDIHRDSACSGTHDHTPDGVPDGWRFRIIDHEVIDPENRLTSFIPTLPNGPQGNGQANTGGFSGEYQVGEITLPPRTSQYVWWEMAWMGDPWGTCTSHANAGTTFFGGDSGWPTNQQSQLAELRVTSRSTNDPALRDVERARAIMDVPPGPVFNDNTAPGSTHGTIVEMAVDQEPFGSVRQPDRFEHAPAFYTVHAINTANEHDQMTVRLDPGRQGWQHWITGITYVPSSITTEPTGFQRQPGKTGTVGTDRSAGDNPQDPSNCAFPLKNGQVDPQPLQVTCTGVGIYDEVMVDVAVLPPFEVRIGAVDDLPITSTTTGPGNVQFTDTIIIKTRVRGDFFFDLEDLAGERITYPGQTIAFPFTVHNEGTEYDEYELTIVEATPQAGGSVSLEHQWNPKLCGEHRVFVPAETDYHGCIAATVPTEWQVGDDRTRVEENFRLRVRSIRGPVGEQQVEILDFTARVEEAPDYTVESEVKTLRSGNAVTFEIEAKTLTGDQEEMAFWVNPETMPAGYEFTCDPSSLTTSATQPLPTCDETIPEADLRFFNPAGNVIGDMTLNAPEDQLGSSRVVSRVRLAPDDFQDSLEEGQLSWHDAITNLASVYGVNLDVLELRQARVEICNDKDIPLRDCLDSRGRLRLEDPRLAGVSEPGLVIEPGPGRQLTFNLLVENPGLSPETVKISNSRFPDTWTLANSDATGQFLQFQGQICPSDAGVVKDKNSTVCLQPLAFFDPELGFENTLISKVPIVVKTTDFLRQGDQTTLVFFAEVVQDPSKKAQVAVPITVGTFHHRLCAVGDATCELEAPVTYGAPQDVKDFSVVVQNTGNVRDTVQLTVVPPQSLAQGFTSEFISQRCVQVPATETVPGARCLIDLAAKENATVLFRLEMAEEITPGALVPITLQSLSKGAGTNNTVTDTLRYDIQVLQFVWQDIEGDGFNEFAIDRDRDPTNGFESFAENKKPGGVSTQWLNGDVLFQYLSEDAVQAHMITDEKTKVERFQYFIDGDGDGRHDHLVDRDFDGLPDIYWDPYHRYAYPIVITKDVNFDGVREYFLDLTGNCRLDAWFDITKGTDPLTGRFNALELVYSDDDNEVDYIVDANGNNQRDPKEVIIKGRTDIACDPRTGLQQIGSILQMVDMNGDGLLDTVVDVDGDGDPDHFLPHGQKNPIPITIKDVTGRDADGQIRDDWLYPSTGQGNPDSYYDWYNDRSGFIDAEGEFLKDLKTYWWIGGLFLFVLLLFVVLVMVTRR